MDFLRFGVILGSAVLNISKPNSPSSSVQSSIPNFNGKLSCYSCMKNDDCEKVVETTCNGPCCGYYNNNGSHFQHWLGCWENRPLDDPWMSKFVTQAGEGNFSIIKNVNYSGIYVTCTTDYCIDNRIASLPDFYDFISQTFIASTTIITPSNNSENNWFFELFDRYFTYIIFALLATLFIIFLSIVCYSINSKPTLPPPNTKYAVPFPVDPPLPNVSIEIPDSPTPKQLPIALPPNEMSVIVTTLSSVVETTCIKIFESSMIHQLPIALPKTSVIVNEV